MGESAGNASASAGAEGAQLPSPPPRQATAVATRAGRLLAVLAALLAVWTLGACTPVRGPGAAAPEPLRLSELAGRGDPQRRSSLELVLRGLDADDAGRPGAARSDYENALRIDPTNPWAYLALARHYAAGTQPARALDFVDQAQALLESQGAWSPGVEPHLAGLRGAALLAEGRRAQGMALLERARELAPGVWSDGSLAARELR